MPQAFTFRAFGADNLSFHTASTAPGSDFLLNEVDYLSYRQALRQPIETEIDFVEPQGVRL